MDKKGNAGPSLLVLGELRSLDELQRELANIFPSCGSLEWEIRIHRGVYVSAGALYLVGRRWMAHPSTFARTALEIGARKAQARSEPR